MAATKPKKYDLPTTTMDVLEPMVKRGAILSTYHSPGDHPLVFVPGEGPAAHCTYPIFHTLIDRGLIEQVPGTTYPVKYVAHQRAEAALKLARLLFEYQITTAQAIILSELAEPKAMLHWDKVGSCQRNIWGERDGRHVLLHKGVARIACTVLRDKELIVCTLRDVCEHWSLTDDGRTIGEAVVALETLDKQAA